MCGIRIIALLAAACLATGAAQARTAQARIARIATAAATLEGVRVRLDWPDGAAQGQLQLWAARVEAPDLGYRYRDLHWRCPLRRSGGGWACAGPVRAGRGPGLPLAVAFAPQAVGVRLGDARTALAVQHRRDAPQRFQLDVRQVPLAWAQALLAQAWPSARFTGGRLQGRLALDTQAAGGLHLHGPLQVAGLGLETRDGTVAAQEAGASLRLDLRQRGPERRLDVAGQLQGGQYLAGPAYLVLPATPVGLHMQWQRAGDGGWQAPRLAWDDGATLQAQARLALAPDARLRALQVQARSADASALPARYLSGWLGVLGLGDLRLSGALAIAADWDAAGLAQLQAVPAQLALADGRGRFALQGLAGDLRYSAGAPVDSALQWHSARLYGLPFGAARLPFASGDGLLRSAADARLPFLDGEVRLHDLRLRPPRGGRGLDLRFGLVVDDVDFGAIARAFALPPFQGRLSGAMPDAHYADDRIDFDGGLSMQLFDGEVVFTGLALERPFGSAPSLATDITFEGLDLARLTSVLGFGRIDGRLGGQVRGLRLVDWTPVAFDAWLATAPQPGVPQRISQNAVQDIGSVGDASFASGLQGRLIALFDTFGYRRLGIGCRLANDVCRMRGLADAGSGFILVEGSGLPRLDVVGHNREVDWPTLVERLRAVARGEVKPVMQ
ncbi:YdbH domain-containing protein [Thermomonas flagellata]|uniref:YdbH domain-containing protein n=1 Tax=Thermomonas flagellata TaxID=2888524 RepID=UPI001F03AD06|nr:YdbH domain-containing protein [Thermomonas flagellata]